MTIHAMFIIFLEHLFSKREYDFPLTVKQTIIFRLIENPFQNKESDS